ncbi:MAG: NAD(P)/FAD-dependent oxidoreductase [Anaerolineales bacterium]|nr:NAD(P)/FAD-dependent oxidoreductase [Anaerolineales bacterium]MCB9128085.1 NAD(P)/FAD-dependent oxidoreductase [Ardenticatenales bacterium]MCB9172112.1 NAD(P)/FAD-dependent oxidoreductase [Ardenticatenales bacterium]
MALPRVVIIGAGFGGLKAAEKLSKMPVEVLLIDRNNYHTFQPLLYQIATAGLDPEEVAHSVRGVFQGQHNVDFRMGTVEGLSWERQTLWMADGSLISFDYLIIAAGASNNFFGIEGVEENAFPLKSVEEAVRMRSHVISQFEAADADPSLVAEGVLNFVVVGGGATGVEMAGALHELFHLVLAHDYRNVDVSQARVILVEAADGLLTAFSSKSQRYALEVLRERGVEVMLDTKVARADTRAVYLADGREIPTKTLIWAAGIRANPLADALGVAQTRGGRIVVNRDLSLPDHRNVFAIGDIAASLDEQGEPLPQVAQVAIQGASHVARQIERQMRGQPMRDFRYRDLGMMATIGRHAAVTELPTKLRFTGFLAWLAWLFLHLMYLVGFRNRLNVFINWMWNYFTYDRSARLILGDGRVDPLREQAEATMPAASVDVAGVPQR